MKNSTTPISVIIVNWNAGDLLKQCVQHLLTQTLLPDVIYIVDNASTDNSLAAVACLDRVEIIALSSNEGFARGNNIALKKITTPYVALLNPDAFPEPQWLENLLTTMLSHPNAASVGSLQLMHGFPNIIDGIGDCYHISGYMWRKMHGEAIGKKSLREQEIFSPCAAAALYRLDAILEVGGFEESFFCYCEDVDLGFRLRARGYTSWYAPTARVSHVGSMTSGGRGSDFAVYHGHRNMMWVYLRNMPLPLLIISLPIHVAANVFAVLLFLVKGRIKLILKSKVDAIKRLPEVLKQRKKIQSQRKVSLFKIFNSINFRR